MRRTFGWASAPFDAHARSDVRNLIRAAARNFLFQMEQISTATFALT